MAGNLLLDSNHDIIIGRGATRVGGVEEVSQIVKCRLLTVFGEWKHDTSTGLPWFDGIFTKTVRTADIEAAVANVIRSTPGVQQLISITIDTDFREREVRISFVAISDYGSLEDYLTWQQSSTA